MADRTLAEALDELRGALLDPDRLVRATAGGRRHGQRPSVARAELRPVVIKAGPRLQVVTSDGVRPRTDNYGWSEEAAGAVDSLLAEPFANWRVETTSAVLEVRVTKRGNAQLHRSAGLAASGGLAVPAGPAALRHDRGKAHVIDPGDPLFSVIGASAAKRRQVDAFVRAVRDTVPRPAAPAPLRVVDLGCGNAYLTFAAYRHLTQAGFDAEMIGVDIRDDQRQRNTELAEALGWQDRVSFVASSIEQAAVSDVNVVLALHACDTATDEALARAVTWRAEFILAAPCCHHDIAAQLRRGGVPAPFGLVTQHAILRERLADTLTDALRAALLRARGYQVDVIEFVESQHTPRNTLIRARRVDRVPEGAEADYRELVSAWGVRPRLETLLGQRA